MKKTLSLILAGLMLILSTFTASAAQINSAKNAASLAAAPKGDIDNNKLITPLDAALILRRSVSLEEFSNMQDIVADVDYDGKISAVDAFITLNYSIGIKDNYVKFDSGIYEASPRHNVPLAWQEQNLYHKGDTVTIDYCLKNVPHIASLGTDLYFDPEYLEFKSAETVITEATIPLNHSQPGLIRIASIFDIEGNTNDFSNKDESETFITFQFQALKDFTLYDLNIYEETFELTSVSNDNTSLIVLISEPDKLPSTDVYSSLNMSINTTSGKNPQYSENNYLTIGDLDGDGKITVMDATQIQYYLANMKNPHNIGKTL